MGQHVAAGIGGTLIVIVLIALYWAPAIVAQRRKVTNLGSIVVCNLFAFMVIPWIVAAIWAFKDVPPTRTA